MKFKLSIALLALMVIHGCDSGSGSIESKKEDGILPAPKETVGWYFRTAAKSTADDGTEYIHETAGIMGEFKESLDGKDRHDIASYGTPALSVLFVQNEWGEDNGNYFSDYRAYNGNDTRQVWTIQVKNNTSVVNLKNAPLKLTLDGLYNIYEEDNEGRVKYKEIFSDNESKKQMMNLVDVDHQREYTYEELQNIELSMDGMTTRTFRWVLGAVEERDYESLGIASKVVKNIDKNENTSVVVSGEHTLGLPPSF